MKYFMNQRMVFFYFMYKIMNPGNYFLIKAIETDFEEI